MDGFEFWLMTEASFGAFSVSLRDAYKKHGVELFAQPEDEDEDEQSHLLTIQDGIGLIEISGPMQTKATFWARMMGSASYQDIRNAMVQAEESGDVETILLDMDTPGGSARGVYDVVELMGKLSKPIHAFTGGDMLSAGYLIGSAADRVYASKMANVGSIGAIAVHMDLTKMLDMEGVKPTIFRAGDHKALGGPYETLSKEAKADLQGKIDAHYENFLLHVAGNRNMSLDGAREMAGDSREFFGYEALARGLVDEITTIDDLFGKLRSKTSRTALGQVNDMARKKLLSEQDVNLLAAGGTLDATLETPVPADPPVDETPAPATDVKAEAPANPTPEPAITDFLRTELSTAQDKITQQTLRIYELEKELSSIKTTHGGLRSIAQEALNHKAVALTGQTVLGADGLTDEGLIQQYQKTSETFFKTFKEGRKSQLPSVEENTDPSGPVQSGKLRAVKF